MNSLRLVSWNLYSPGISLIWWGTLDGFQLRDGKDQMGRARRLNQGTETRSALSDVASIVIHRVECQIVGLRRTVQKGVQGSVIAEHRAGPPNLDRKGELVETGVLEPVLPGNQPYLVGTLDGFQLRDGKDQIIWGTGQTKEPKPGRDSVTWRQSS